MQDRGGGGGMHTANERASISHKGQGVKKKPLTAVCC